MKNPIRVAFDVFGNYFKETNCYIRETQNDLSVYGQTDGLTDDLIKAGQNNGLTIVSSPFKRSNGFTHFVKFANFEQTKNKMESIKSLPFKIKVIHLDKRGNVI